MRTEQPKVIHLQGLSGAGLPDRRDPPEVRTVLKTTAWYTPS
ncbi:hypothetical protein ACPA9J_23000 [Pseudomonas aeruginosa]